jgi:hypothetical protein
MKDEFTDTTTSVDIFLERHKTDTLLLQIRDRIDEVTKGTA